MFFLVCGYHRSIGIIYPYYITKKKNSIINIFKCVAVILFVVVLMICKNI